MTTALGRKNRNTATFGCRTIRHKAGRRTATVTGPGSGLGVGRGSTTRPGVLRLITTAAGIGLVPTGVGALVRSTPILTMAPHSSDLSADLASVSALAGAV